MTVGEILLVAGKGHEHTQDIQIERFIFQIEILF